MHSMQKNIIKAVILDQSKSLYERAKTNLDRHTIYFEPYGARVSQLTDTVQLVKMSSKHELTIHL